MRALLLFSCCVLGKKMRTTAKKHQSLARVRSHVSYLLWSLASCATCTYAGLCLLHDILRPLQYATLKLGYIRALLLVFVLRPLQHATLKLGCVCCLFSCSLDYVLGRKLCTAAKKQPVRK